MGQVAGPHQAGPAVCAAPAAANQTDAADPVAVVNGASAVCAPNLPADRRHPTPRHMPRLSVAPARWLNGGIPAGERPESASRRRTAARTVSPAGQPPSRQYPPITVQPPPPPCRPCHRHRRHHAAPPPPDPLIRRCASKPTRPPQSGDGPRRHPKVKDEITRTLFAHSWRDLFR